MSQPLLTAQDLQILTPAEQDHYWMSCALHWAKVAAQQGEVPIGAVLVQEQRCLAEGYNQPIQAHDPTAHAEIIAIRQAAAKSGNYRLPGTTLYVTLEPCVMCVGAIIHARIARVVYAAADSKIQGDKSAYRSIDLIHQHYFNHHPLWEGGCCDEAASDMLRGFFQSRR